MSVSPYILPGLKLPINLLKPHEETLNRICKYYDVTLEQLKKKSRKRDLVVARQVCMCAMYYKYGWTLSRAGKLFNRDHTTAIHSLDTIKNICETDSFFKQQVEFLVPDVLSKMKNLNRNQKRFRVRIS